MQHHFEKRGLHSKLNFVNIWKISMCNLKEFWNNLDFKSETVEIWISRQYFFVYFTCCNTKTREISWREIQILTKSLLKSKLVFWYAFIIWHSSFTGFKNGTYELFPDASVGWTLTDYRTGNLLFCFQNQANQEGLNLHDLDWLDFTNCNYY